MNRQEWKKWWEDARCIAKIKALRFAQVYPEVSVVKVPIFLPLYPWKAEQGCNIVFVHITTLDFDIWQTFEVWQDEIGEELTWHCQKRKGEG